MKKMVKMLLCMLMCAACLSVAAAQGVECAGKLVELTDLEYYPAYTCDAETGKWSLHAYQADALLDRFWDFGMRNSQRTVVFHLAAEGDARTGVWTPVLRFYHIDGEATGARAVSVLVDGVRYDLAASASRVSRAQYTAECVTVPLNEQGMQVARAMQQAEKLTVRLLGEKVYTLTYDREAVSTRQSLEAASLIQLASGLQLMDELKADSYGLWDLSARAWQQEYGYLPAVTVSDAQQELCGKPLTDAMGMVLPTDSSDASAAAQEKLIEYGFLSGTVSRRMTDEAQEAVLRAQKYLGRVQTGCMDAALVDALEEGRDIHKKEQTELLALGQDVEVGLDRYWFADGVSASANTGSLRSVVNADHTFLIADGQLRNLGMEEMHLFMQLEASVIYNGRYAYQAELVCEGGDGKELDTRLLPMEQARLIAYAEIPAQLAMDEQAQWSIGFEWNGENLVIELE